MGFTRIRDDPTEEKLAKIRSPVEVYTLPRRINTWHGVTFFCIYLRPAPNLGGHNPIRVIRQDQDQVE